jgi:HD-GYP domain-containing protein (c-di-GMP phosphodiesterase class II)
MATDNYIHEDILAGLNKPATLNERLEYLHTVLKRRYPFLSRIAVAIYDDKTDMLKTFVHSEDTKPALQNYHARLSDSGSLSEVIARGQPRVINNLNIFDRKPQEHTRRLRNGGIVASYTMPMYTDGRFIGFIFFNADHRDVFDQAVLQYLDLFGHMLTLLVAQELTMVNTLFSTLQTARYFSQVHDQETAAHLERMSHYSLLIARQVADKFGIDDEYIEYIFQISPLHDIGKIGIPEAILKKPARLSDDEFRTMQEHAARGREIVDRIMKNAHLESFPHLHILRNITEFHHEAYNGSGYPLGLHADDIPIESRIIAVADVFDALTSTRTYKRRWSNDEAYARLRRLSGYTLDPDCVAALVNNPDAVNKIQARFADTDDQTV